MYVTLFWDAAPCGVVELADRYFRGALSEYTAHPRRQLPSDSYLPKETSN
jgi:hypothetical protein